MEEDQQPVHFEAQIQLAELEDMNHLSCASSALFKNKVFYFESSLFESQEKEFQPFAEGVSES